MFKCKKCSCKIRSFVDDDNDLCLDCQEEFDKLTKEKINKFEAEENKKSWKRFWESPGFASIPRPQIFID